MSAVEPVVLLHGLFRTRRSMSTAARWLSQHGFEPHCLGYPSTKRSITDLARGVSKDLDSRFAGDSRRVHFLTHSMGGVVLRALLSQQDELSDQPPWRFGRVAMLAPPNQGSRVAEALGERRIFRWLFGEAGQELRAGERCMVPTLPMPKETGIIAGTRSVGSYGFVFRNADARGITNDGTVGTDEVKLSGVPFVEVPAGHTFIMNSQEALQQAAHFFRHGKFQ